MDYQDFEKNAKTFFAMIENVSKKQKAPLNLLLDQYTKQHVALLNEIMLASIDNLKKIETAKSPEEIICAQARFTNDLMNKFTKSTQNFLNASLGQIVDYNDWLKSHCDVVTD